MNDYKPDIVFYHAPCDDGIAAAAVVANYYENKRTTEEKIAFLPWNYSKPGQVSELIDICRGKHVLLVDCSMSKDMLNKVAQSAESILIIDHHITAKKDLAEYIIDANVNSVGAMLAENKIAMVYDVNYSGASLTFKFFNPDAKVPAFIKYVENIDLGKEDLPNASYLKYWNRSNKLDLSVAQANVRMLVNDGMLQPIFDSGKEIKRYADNVIEQVAKEHRIGNFGDKQFPFVFAIYYSGSDIANYLLSPRIGEYEFSMVFYFTNTGLGASIRSVPEFDCSIIAKHFGGGGHAQAAGFNIPWAKFGWFYNEMKDAGTDLFGQQ